MLGLKLIYICKRGPRRFQNLGVFWYTAMIWNIQYIFCFSLKSQDNHEDDIIRNSKQGFYCPPKWKYEFINYTCKIKLVSASEQCAAPQYYHCFFNSWHCYLIKILLKYDPMIFRLEDCYIFHTCLTTACWQTTLMMNHALFIQTIHHVTILSIC